MFKLSGNSLFFYLILIIIFLGAIYLVQGVLPNMPIESLSNPFTAPTTIENAKDTGGFYTLHDNPIGNGNKQQLQLVPVNGMPVITSCPNSVIFLIVDSSAAMADPIETGLKSGLLALAASLADDTYISYIPFSHAFAQIIPVEQYSVAKTAFTNEINNFSPGDDRQMADPFRYLDSYYLQYMLSQLTDNPKVNIIFISGGVPESTAMNTTCTTNNVVDTSQSSCTTNCQIDSQTHQVRCFDPSQDPTNNAADLKNKGVTIYSISYPEKDSFFADKQKILLTTVASPNDTYVAPSNEDITSALGTIAKNICE